MVRPWPRRFQGGHFFDLTGHDTIGFANAALAGVANSLLVDALFLTIRRRAASTAFIAGPQTEKRRACPEGQTSWGRVMLNDMLMAARRRIVYAEKVDEATDVVRRRNTDC
jgi:hypothetical protein